MTRSVVDGTSKLPISILQNILLFLPADDAARTTILSKTWWAAWASLPVFTFEFDGNLRPYRKATMEDLQEEGKKLMKFIRDSEIKLQQLGQHKAFIKKFRIDIVLQDPENFSPYINKFIGLVTRNCVRKLYLQISEHGQSTSFYTLPCAALAVKSLVVLELRNFRLEGSLLTENWKFSCLREICLSCVQLDDEVMSQLIQSSPVLEDFSVVSCSGFKHLLILNLPKLRKVRLDQCIAGHHMLDEIKIEAEHLRSFCYRGPRGKLVIKMLAFKYLKELILVGVEMSDQLFDDLVSELPLLEDLSLGMCFGLKRVKLSSVVLKKLQLELRSLQEVVIDAPNLILYDYSGDGLPSIFKFNTLSLQEAFLTLFIDYHVDTFWFLSLRQYLGSFEQHNNLTLHINYSKPIYFLSKELQEFSVPQLPVVKCISVKESEVSSASYEAWLDGLLWCCHPAHVTVESSPLQGHNEDFVSFLYEKMHDTAELHQWCNSSSTKCWRHFVKDVQHESRTEDEYSRVISQVCLALEWEGRCLGDSALNIGATH